MGKVDLEDPGTDQSMQISARSTNAQPVKITPQGQCFLTHQELCKLTQQDKDERRIRVYSKGASNYVSLSADKKLVPHPQLIIKEEENEDEPSSIVPQNLKDKFEIDFYQNRDQDS